MNIGIIGLGLIGASFGRSIIKNTNFKVFGLDISEEVMESAELIQAVNFRLNDKNVKKLDALFIALYPNDIKPTMEKYCPLLKDGAIISDLCGNKRAAVSAMKELSAKFPKLNFISCHPMAGREFSGVKHSTASLFERASMIAVPVRCEIEALAFIKDLSVKVGFSKVVITTAENHDKMIAFTSQMAHIVSSSYIKSESAEKHFGYSAGSYRDMTRVARLNPQMWTELMLENSDNLSKELEEFIGHLSEYLNALKNKDENALYTLLKEGNERKLTIEKNKAE